MFENIVFLAATEAHGGGESAIVQLFNNFGLDVKILIAQIINFVIVTVLLYKFAFKPVLATIEERQKKISDGLKFSEEAEAKLADSEKQHAATLQKAQQESQAILAEARNNAKALMDKQSEETAAKTEEMINKAKEAIELERKKMITEVRGEVTRLVVETTSKVLSKELSDTEKSRYNQSASKELSQVGS
ncbi:MAG: F0F1 ATP synthase subunit B [Verrucomicrobiae bacterium]|nr:F0F1 ATP synthase subunit B [Verrucomicrobiae bacterium]